MPIDLCHLRNSPNSRAAHFFASGSKCSLYILAFPVVSPHVICNTLECLYSKDYLEDKKKARQAKQEEKNKKMDRKKAAIVAKMTSGALLEISGLPESGKL